MIDPLALLASYAISCDGVLYPTLACKRAAATDSWHLKLGLAPGLQRFLKQLATSARPYRPAYAAAAFIVLC